MIYLINSTNSIMFIETIRPLISAKNCVASVRRDSQFSFLTYSYFKVQTAIKFTKRMYISLLMKCHRIIELISEKSLISFPKSIKINFRLIIASWKKSHTTVIHDALFPTVQYLNAIEWPDRCYTRI